MEDTELPDKGFRRGILHSTIIVSKMLGAKEFRLPSIEVMDLVVELAEDSMKLELRQEDFDKMKAGLLKMLEDRVAEHDAAVSFKQFLISEGASEPVMRYTQKINRLVQDIKEIGELLGIE